MSSSVQRKHVIHRAKAESEGGGSPYSAAAAVTTQEDLGTVQIWCLFQAFHSLSRVPGTIVEEA